MKMILYFFSLLCFALFFSPGEIQAQRLCLRDNLNRAKPGDYVVVSFDKMLTLMHIYDKKNQILTIEEVSIPQKNQPKNWRKWIEEGAPGNIRWVLYDVNIQKGTRIRSYSFTKKYWFDVSEMDDLLSKILNLNLQKIPDSERNRIGPKFNSGPDLRSIWNPCMIVDGTRIKGVAFDAWRTRWPRDASQLSGRIIEVYVPQDSQAYPSYFPYWLQINGAMGKAKIRIVDSGSELKSPKPSLEFLLNEI